MFYAGEAMKTRPAGRLTKDKKSCSLYSPSGDAPIENPQD